MRPRFWIRTIGLLCGAVTAVLSCMQPAEPTPQAIRPGAARAHARSAAPDSELRLFGEGNIARSLTFRGRAALNLEQHTTPTEGADFDPCVDAGGKFLVFASTRHSPRSHLYVKPIDGTAITQLTDENANDAQPAVSPDGKRVAFASDRAGQWDIWIVDMTGRNAVQVTHHPAPELHPSWSPDGRRLVYCRLTGKEGGGELWVSDLANPAVKRLIGEGLFPAWSPKGDKIVFQRARARGSRWFSIWTIDFVNDEASLPTEIASSNSAALIAPAWSPDGLQISFCIVPAAERSEAESFDDFFARACADIGIVDADGRGLQRLTDGRGQHYSPAWSGDDRIFFTKRLGAIETIWSVRVFRPSAPSEPPTTTTGNRRAAQLAEPVDE